MINRALIFQQTGDVNRIFGVIPNHLNEVNHSTTQKEYVVLQKKNEKSILEYFRCDRDRNVIGPDGPETNESKDSTEVKFCYNPVFYRQHIAYNLPYKLTETITVIDSFACMGSRFGLKQLQVFVEVYQSNCGNNRIWANIFYVADSEIPACTIKIIECRYES